MLDGGRRASDQAPLSEAFQGFSIPRKAVHVTDSNLLSPATSIASLQSQQANTSSQTSQRKPDEEAFNKAHLQHKPWRSRSLQRRTLLAFAGTFIALLAAIEAIIQVSHNNKGLANADENAYYLWTYGPVAILTVTLAFWSRIEYRSKQLAPYILLNSDPASTHQAVHLDYVSPIAPTTISQAVRNCNVLVALASVSSLLVTLLIVVSTSLLGLRSFQLDQTGIKMAVSDSFVKSVSSLPDSPVSQMPFYVYDAINNLTLKYPAGTTASFAYQNFTSADPSAADTLTAEVDGFSATLTCEPTMLHFGGLSLNVPTGGQPYSSYAPFDDVSNVTVSLGGCEAKLTPPLYTTAIGVKQTFGQFLKVACADGGDEEDSQRILIYTMELMINSSASPDEYHRTYYYSITRSTQLLCRPSYSLPRLSVTIDRASGEHTAATLVDSSPVIDGGKITGLSAWNLTDLILDAVAVISPYNSDDYWGPVVKLARQSGIKITDEDMFDISILQALFPPFFASVSAQVAKESFMRSSQDVILGASTTARTRLTVRSLSARIMEATLVVLAVAAVIMAVFCPRTVSIPCDPGSIAGTASVFSLNQPLLEHMKNDVPPEKTQLAQQSWRPLVLKPLARSLGLVTIAAVVVVLETLLQVSRKHSGIVNVNLNQYIHYTWSYIPALMMVIIKLFALSLDFNTRLMAPFSRLRRGGTYKNALNVSYLKHLAPAAIVSSVRARQFAVTATTLMALIGGLLTIVVSGVYDVAQIPTQSPVQVQRQDSFRSVENLTLDITSDDKGGMLGALILDQNLSYPKWTYDEYVFPKLETVRDTSDLELGDFIDTTVSALHAQLHCRYLTGPEVNASVNWTEGGKLNVVKPPALATYVNTQSDIYLGGLDPVVEGGVFGTADWSGVGNGIGDPPEYAYIWGSLSGREIDHIVILMCDEDIHTIDVSARFSLPSFSIDSGVPPVPVVATSKWFTNLFLLEPYSGQLPREPDGPFPQDEFFTLLVEGSGGIEVSDLKEPSKIDKIVDTIKHFHGIVRAQQYNIVLRQAPGQNETLATLRFPSTMTSNSRSRLIQHAVSTRVLEGMLLAMLVLGAAATFMMKTRDVLLESPCTIAAMARLLAQSSILEGRSGSESTQDFSPSESLAEAESSEGRIFRLDWFDWRGDSQEKTRVFTIRAVDSVELPTRVADQPPKEAIPATATARDYSLVATHDAHPSFHSEDLDRDRDEERGDNAIPAVTSGRDGDHRAETDSLVRTGYQG
ncbi:hypothetical protein A1O7_09093 [Cladophialophora yegresii CBS 114405]|uniref:Uncharacterized protein n=1 Tax=Cladophialophora yegresii CBS 114405 TaxID=1182544 RepID=W9VKE6_9EURO|nr:uncharacterized protein A1O7_09093 [Cladophialophora yegresii CBS 114405]EXJ56162.1 hypothetical protein A1O7_09093 [Cladophialophora yegresii CBS 114405]